MNNLKFYVSHAKINRPVLAHANGCADSFVKPFKLYAIKKIETHENKAYGKLLLRTYEMACITDK